MNGIRVHNKRRPSLSRWLTMAEVAERFGLEGEEAIRDARRLLLKAQKRTGAELMWKCSESNQGHWYTTEALVKRHAPELVDTDPEAIRAVTELRDLLQNRLDKVEERCQELELATGRRLRKMSVQLERIAQANKT